MMQTANKTRLFLFICTTLMW